MYKYAKVYKSRRGDYIIDNKYQVNLFSVQQLKDYVNSFKGIDRIKKLCEEELDLFLKKDVTKLSEHPFWKGESINLLLNYMDLYNSFFEKYEKSEKTSKNIITLNDTTCITALQYCANQLLVYQRSCDLSLGYLADAITLTLIAEKLNCEVICWFIGVPHIYILIILRILLNSLRLKLKLKWYLTNDNYGLVCRLWNR